MVDNEQDVGRLDTSLLPLTYAPGDIEVECCLHSTYMDGPMDTLCRRQSPAVDAHTNYVYSGVRVVHCDVGGLLFTVRLLLMPSAAYRPRNSVESVLARQIASGPNGPGTASPHWCSSLSTWSSRTGSRISALLPNSRVQFASPSASNLLQQPERSYSSMACAMQPYTAGHYRIAQMTLPLPPPRQELLPSWASSAAALLLLPTHSDADFSNLLQVCGDPPSGVAAPSGISCWSPICAIAR